MGDFKSAIAMAAIAVCITLQGCAGIVQGEKRFEELTAPIFLPPGDSLKNWSWSRLRKQDGPRLYHEIGRRFETGDKLPRDIACAVAYYLRADRSEMVSINGQMFYGSPWSRNALKRLVKDGQWPEGKLPEYKDTVQCYDMVDEIAGFRL